MNPNLQTFLTYKEVVHKGEVNTMPSKTQPDMVLSLQDLLERHVRGLEVPQFAGNFEDEDAPFLPDPKSLDLSEIHAMRVANAEKIEQLKKPKPAPKQPATEGAEKPAEGGKPPESGGQNSTTEIK